MRRGCLLLTVFLCLGIVAGCAIKRPPKPEVDEQQTEQRRDDGEEPDSRGLADILAADEAERISKGMDESGKARPPGPGVDPEAIFEHPRSVPERRTSFEDNLSTSTGRRRASNEQVAEGRRDLGAGRDEIAVSRFEKAIEIDPKNPFPYYYLAEARLKEGRYDQAEPLASKAAAYFEDDGHWVSRCHLIRAKALMARGETREAYSAIQRALAWDAASEEALALERQIKLQLGIP